jgi:hypothetical protein
VDFEGTMAKDEFNIPPQARDFAEKSVEQARRSFDTLTGAAQTAVNSTGTYLPSATREFNGKILSFTEENVGDLFDLAQRIIQAKNMGEVLKLQTEFMNSATQRMQKQAGELSASLQDTITQKK